MLPQGSHLHIPRLAHRKRLPRKEWLGAQHTTLQVPALQQRPLVEVPRCSYKIGRSCCMVLVQCEHNELVYFSAHVLKS